MAMRERNVQLKFRVTEQEREQIEHRMEQAGTTNRAAYLRKIAVDGYIVRLNFSELREMLSLLRRCGNNFNQVAKRVNETGRLYDTDLTEMREQLDQLEDIARDIVTKLASIG